MKDVALFVSRCIVDFRSRHDEAFPIFIEVPPRLARQLLPVREVDGVPIQAALSVLPRSHIALIAETSRRFGERVVPGGFSETRIEYVYVPGASTKAMLLDPLAYPRATTP